jgi:hypothetical protein
MRFAPLHRRDVNTHHIGHPMTGHFFPDARDAAVALTQTKVM